MTIKVFHEMKMWVHLPVTLELPSSVEAVIIDKETTPTQLRQRQIKTNRRTLELVVVVVGTEGVSVPITNATAKARGFF